MTDKEEKEDSSGESPVARWPTKARSKRLRYLGHGTYVCRGPSGEDYRFLGHGSVLKVKADDVDDLLGRGRVQKTCCAGSQTRQAFFAAV